MEKIKNAIKNNLLLVLAITSGVLILGGVILIVLGITLASKVFFKVMFIVTSVAMILLGCAMTYFIMLIKDKNAEPEEPNLFLYDSASGKNMSASVLDFELVNKRMTFFMSRASSSIRALWSGNIFANDELFDGVDELKTLLAYKMIYDLADKDIPALWELYLNADASLISAIETELRNNGDEIGKYVIKLHSTANGSAEKSRKFLMDNKSYLEGKMLACAKSNIDKF